MAVVLAAVDHSHDVRVGELGDRARFPLEALDEVVVGHVLVVEDLQRDVALEQRVVRPVHARHAARSDELLELVPLIDRLADHGRKLPA